MRRRWISTLLVACVAAPAALIAGCGGGGAGGDVDVGPATAVPAGAALYVDGTVEPTGQVRTDANAALGKVLDTPDPGGKIVSLIEGQAKAGGHPFNYERDVAPWLGEQAGFFFTDLTDNAQKGAAVIETTNPGAALAFARKVSGATATSPAPQTYNGASYQAEPDDPTTVFGTVGDFLVTGDVEGFKGAVDAEKGDSLGDNGDFKDSLDQLPSSRLGTFYTVPKTLIDALGPAQIDQQTQAAIEKSAGNSLEKPVAGALTASADTLDLQFIGGDNGVETPESSLIGDVPADSWLALGLGNLGDAAKRTIDQLKEQGVPNIEQGIAQVEQATGASIDQLTNALGDAVVYVRGESENTLNGALVIQTKDPDLTGRLLSQLQTLVQLGSQGTTKPLQLDGGGTGFRINDPTQTPQPVEFAQQGDKIVIGYGANSAARSLAPRQTLGDSPTFSSAKGQVSDLGTDLFLDLPKVLRLAEAQGAKSDPGYAQAKPYIDALSYLVSGSGTKNDQAELKAVVGLK
ncbi:MAG TPA: DUF3352 domain-containing protein [Solirubrobacterales bacterium]|nr:DUF3352 domain-containing protein [Solirubrobacterales bacterium]